MSRKSTLLRASIGAIALIIISSAILWSLRPSPDDYRPIYNALSEEHRTLTPSKPPFPKELPWDQHDRTEDYRNVLASIPNIPTSTQDPASKHDAHMWTQTTDTTQPIPEPCIQAGIPKDTPDAFLRSWDSLRCTNILTHQDRAKTFLDLARSTHPAAPFSIWDPNSPDPSAPLSFIPIINLAGIALDRAYIDSISSNDLEPILQTTIALIHMGYDLQRKASLLHALLGVSLQDRATRTLTRLANAHVDIPPHHAHLLVQSLLHLSKYPNNTRDILIADHLVTSAQLLPQDESFQKPPIVRNNDFYKTLVADSFHAPLVVPFFLYPFLESQGHIFSKLPTSFEDRTQAFKQYQTQAAESSNPLTRVATYDLGRADRVIAAQQSYICLLLFAFSTRTSDMRHTTPLSFDAFPQPVRDACLKDPNTGQQPTLRVEKGEGDSPPNAFVELPAQGFANPNSEPWRRSARLHR